MKKLVAAACLAAVFLAGCAAPASSSLAQDASSSSVASAAAGQVVRAAFYGITFEYDNQYALTEDASDALVFEQGKAFVTILCNDMQGIFNSLEEAEALALTMDAYLGGFEDVQMREDYDLAVAGMPAVGTTCAVNSSGTWVNYSLITFFSGETNYAFAYAATVENAPTRSYADEFMRLMNSIEIA